MVVQSVSFFCFLYIKRMASRWLTYTTSPAATVNTVYSTADFMAGDGILISDTGVISNVHTVRDGELSQNSLSNERLLTYEEAANNVDDILNDSDENLNTFKKIVDAYELGDSE